MPSLADRSTWVTGCAFALGLVAMGATTAYLRPLELGTWPNLLMAFGVLAAPLAGHPPLTMKRLLVTAAVWVGVGMPGAWFFGSPVFYAGCLLGLAVAARLFLLHEQTTADA